MPEQALQQYEKNRFEERQRLYGDAKSPLANCVGLTTAHPSNPRQTRAHMEQQQRIYGAFNVLAHPTSWCASLSFSTPYMPFPQFRPAATTPHPAPAGRTTIPIRHRTDNTQQAWRTPHSSPFSALFSMKIPTPEAHILQPGYKCRSAPHPGQILLTILIT